MRPVHVAGSHNWLLIGMVISGLAVGFGLGWLIFIRPGLTTDSALAGARSDSSTPLFATLASPAKVNSAPAPVVGVPAPDFTLTTLEGSAVSLSQFRGQPVLINFWATWCAPCRVEMPKLVRAYEAHQSESFVILGVNLTFQDTQSEVRAFVDEFNMTFPVLLDEAGEVTALYRLLGLPLSVFVNRDGVIVRLHIGVLTGSRLDEYVAEILK